MPWGLMKVYIQLHIYNIVFNVSCADKERPLAFYLCNQGSWTKGTWRF